MLRPATLVVLLLTLAPANVFAFDHHHHHSSGSNHSSGGCGGSHSTASSSSQSGTKAPSVPVTAPTEKRVFVTRATTDGNLGGTAGADAFCQRAADAAHLTGTFQAWLSTGSTNAIDRLQGVGPWSTPAGEVAFDGRPDLVGPPLVDLTDELGDALSAKAVAWTGSDGDGRATGTDCSRWTATDTAARGAIGDGLADSGHWGGGAGATPCSMQASLVCFER